MDYRERKNIVIKIIASMLLLCSFAAITNAEEIGRLFFSADERRVMNQKRSEPIRQKQRDVAQKSSAELAGEIEPTESVPLPPPKITGQVIRSSGHNTVWVNHFPQYKRGRQ